MSQGVQSERCKYDNVQITLKFAEDSKKHDVSELLQKKSLKIDELFINSRYKSSVSTANFTIRLTPELRLLFVAAKEYIEVKIKEGEYGSIVFEGIIEPTFTDKWTIPDEETFISLSATDRTCLLDTVITDSISCPVLVDDTPFYIYKRTDTAHSIIYSILSHLSLHTMIAADAPDIIVQPKNLQVISKKQKARDVLDTLLYEYGYALCTTDDKHLTWKPTAFASESEETILDEEDILASPKFTIKQRFITSDGVVVKWPQSAIKNDQLLWRGDLPIGDTSDPTPGELIAAGDYWPEDSDILETFQNFDNKWTDYEYLEGKTRLKNDNASLIASSNQYVKDYKDSHVAIDPINPPTQSIIFEALRCRLRYKNSGTTAERLYWSEVYGKALVKTGEVSTSCPEDAKEPEDYTAQYVYTKTDAEKLAKIMACRTIAGRWDITFSSTNKYDLGQLLRLRQSGKLSSLIIITGRSRSYNLSGIYSYKAVTCEYYDQEFNPASFVDQGSNFAVGRDGKDGDKIITIVPYYALSTSSVTCTSQTWEDDIDDWYKGLFIWQKNLLIYESGLEEFGDAKYNKMLTDQMLGSVSLQVGLKVSKAYEMDLRQPQPAKVYLTFKISGYQSNTPQQSWFSVVGGQVLYDTQKQSWYVSPSADHFTLTLTEPTTGDYTTLDAEGIDVTEYSLYNGPISSLSQFNTMNSKIKVPGDYFLCGDSFSTYKAGEPYVWNGTQWAALTLGPTGQNENEYANIMAHCIDDALTCSVDTNTKFFSFFENLGANAAFIRNLMVYYLSIGSGTPSSGFYMRILDGNPPTIIATYDGNEIWKIDATTGKMYGNFARVLQYMPFNFDDSLDSTCPAEFEFYIPSSAEIKSIKLNVRGQKYRAYSKGAKLLQESQSSYDSGYSVFPWPEYQPNVTIPAAATETDEAFIAIPTGGQTKSDFIYGSYPDGAHSHDLKYGYSQFSTEQGGSSWADYHTHNIGANLIPTGVDGDGSHKHAVTLNQTESKGHKHSLPNGIGKSGTFAVNNLTHYHNVDISHEHDLVFGIYEGTRPANVTCYIDNGSGYGTGISLGSAEALATDLNLTSYLSGTGWKKIKFTSSRLGRITVQLIAELLVTT